MKSFEIFGLLTYAALVIGILSWLCVILHKLTGLWSPSIILMVVGTTLTVKMIAGLVNLIERVRSN